jgi:hypothetical protein
VSQRVLLLVGSGKAAGTSTSQALGGYLLDRLEARGVVTRTRLAARSVRGERVTGLLRDLDESDTLVIASPLYVDALPYLVSAAMEAIAAHRARQDPRPPVRLAVVLNCGFPEPRQCDTALGICRSFARHAGLEWAGALALGGGGVVAGRNLAALGSLGRRLRSALDLAAAALAAGGPVPDEAVRLLARPLVPARLYNLMAELDWLRQARRNGALTRLRARPFV